MRLFVAIDIPDAIRTRIAAYMKELDRAAPDARIRWVLPESLHVTLKFIGESQQVEKIKQVLVTDIRGAPFEISFQSAGFFTPSVPRVFWIGLKAPQYLAELAKQVDAALATIGIAPETREFRPHLTLARAGSGNPHGARKNRLEPGMSKLRRVVEANPRFAQPGFGTITAREFYLYQSVLARTGSQYTKLARFPLEP